MSEVTPFPRALEAWEPELRHFARDLVGQVVALSERVVSAIGPLRVRAERQSEEPNGYASLARRGPYDRLLVSEWALQLEAPDEFVRRASAGEHLFLELDRRSPVASREAWLLLDTGPSQLGSPRVAQLATIVAFARRAREAKLTLRWAPLWNWEKPAHEGVTHETVLGWLFGRVPWEPTPGLLSQWFSRWSAHDEGREVERDVWLCGGAGVEALAAQHQCSAVVIDDGGADAATLEVRVTPHRRRRPAVLRLPLPGPQEQVRLLRDPFEWRQPKPQPAPQSRGPMPTIAVEPLTELAFSHDGHRLLARTLDGGVVAMPVKNTARAGYGWPVVGVLPPGTSLIAASWASRRARGLVVANRHGVVYGCEWTGRLGVRYAGEAPKPLPSEVFVAGWPMQHGWEMRGLWFDPMVDRVDGAWFTARAVHGLTLALRQGPESKFLDEGRRKVLTMPYLPERAWLAWGAGTFAAACQLSDRVDVVLSTTSVEKGQPQVRSLPRALFAVHRVQAVVAGFSSATLVAVSRDRRGVHSLMVSTVAPQWKEEARARAPIQAFACSHDGRYLAWRDMGGELAVYSRERGEVVLRVHVSNVSKEVT